MAAIMEQKNMLTNLFHLYSADCGRGKLELNTFLATADSQKLFSIEADGVHEVIRHINSCLGATKSRVEGLCLLEVVVAQCTTAAFQQHALTWIKLLLNILQGHSTREVYTRCCHVMSQILDHSRTFADVAREITTSVITQLLPLLLTATGKKKEAALHCIRHCIVQYPGPVGPFKGKLQGYIVEALEAGEGGQELFGCFALLAGCGPGGTQGIKHTQAWSDLCSQLLASLHQALDGLYQDILPGGRNSYQGRPLDLSIIDDSSPNRVMCLYKRWQALCSCMVYFLRVEFSSVAKIPVVDILQLVYRSLNVNVPMLLARETSERCLLAVLVGKIHMSALNVLQQLVLLCGSNLMGQGSQIVGALVQELVWTHQPTTGADHTYGYLRAVVYNVLSTWMQCLRAGAGMLKEETTLVKELLHDCLPLTSTFQLHTGSQEGSGSSKKRKKQAGYQEISEGLSTQRKSNTRANQHLVKAALDALDWLVLTSGSFLNKKLMKDIHQFVVGTVARVQSSPDTVVPYASPECRRSLYIVLQTCVLTPTPGVPSLTQYATALFATGVYDKHREVSACCVKAMAVCEGLIHPRAPCLQAPRVSDTRLEIHQPLPAATSVQRSHPGSQTLDHLTASAPSASSPVQSISLNTVNSPVGNIASRPTNELPTTVKESPVRNQSTSAVVDTGKGLEPTETVVVEEGNSIAIEADRNGSDKVVVIDSDGRSSDDDDDNDKDDDNNKVLESGPTGSNIANSSIGPQSKDDSLESKGKNSTEGKSPLSRKHKLSEENAVSTTDTSKSHSPQKKRQNIADNVTENSVDHISIDSDSDVETNDTVTNNKPVGKSRQSDVIMEEDLSSDGEQGTVSSADVFTARKIAASDTSDPTPPTADIEMMVATFVDAGPDSD